MNRTLFSYLRYALLALAGWVAHLPTSAQNLPSEGVVHYTRTTRWTKVQSSLSFLSKQEKERMSYMYESRDEWKEYMVLYFNDKATKYESSEERNANNNGYSWRKQEFLCARNFATNRMTDVFDILGKIYLVEDSLSLPNWKIQNDLKDVAGHICMKASVEDTVKKQKIVAWFAQDITHPGGPERYFGLPGMILELDINNGAVVIAAERIEAKKLTNELDLPKKLKGKTISETAYQQMLYKMIQEKTKQEQNPYWSIRY
jgi:GLPGLI family protein